MTILQAYDPSMEHRKVLQAVIIHDHQCLLDQAFDTPELRRDAVLWVLSQELDIVEEDRVRQVLATHPDDVDAGLEEIVQMHTDADGGVVVYLTWMFVPTGPKELHTVLTDYGDGTQVIEHYPTAAARLEQLRGRAALLASNGTEVDEFFAAADQETCRRTIEGKLVPVMASVSLYTSRARQDGSGSWLGEGSGIR